MSVTTVGAMGCGAAASDDNATGDEAIVNGSADTTHRAAVTITWTRSLTATTVDVSGCSGVLIRNNVVLTAGHCLTSANAKSVPAVVNSPFAGKSSSSSGTALAGYNGTDSQASLDVGLIFLKTPIDLPVYPTIVGTELNIGSSPKVEAVGRTHNGTSTNSLWTSAVLTVTQATATSYVTGATDQGGDSGGPVFKAGTTQLVGVMWGGNNSTWFTRSDLFKAKVASLIASH